MKPVIEFETGAILRHSNEKKEKEKLSLTGNSDISMSLFINMIKMYPKRQIPFIVICCTFMIAFRKFHHHHREVGKIQHY